MRASCAPAYTEVRDAIARDWYSFFSQLGLNHQWILLPNLGDDTVSYAKHWGIEALILSGGDDFGADECRDSSELQLLNYCIDERLPVLGICRGAQLIQHYFGGQLAKIDSKSHLATRHQICTTQTQPWWPGVYNSEVNSFHASKLVLPLPQELSCFAYAGDQCEGVMHQSLKVLGVMWHPEREVKAADFDIKLFNWLFA